MPLEVVEVPLLTYILCANGDMILCEGVKQVGFLPRNFIESLNISSVRQQPTIATITLTPLIERRP